ncbi:spheroidene monooxygenase [Actinocorallia populi]|uniref:spheroidene monooxygenase n=1 Tax=Actinocorallia populi TaxID=2079200 RepID=UPI001E312282|nr:spheroidene monooxygenase [Actinocorallia populi]
MDAGAMRHMGLDRPVLRATEGLLFWRLMGTGRGTSMTLGADLRRWALLAVWRDERHLERFLRYSPIAARWRDEAEECWQVRLLPLASRGRWGGTEPFGQARRPSPVPDCGPVAVLTRASIRPGRLVAFYRSVAPVQNALLRQKGCLASVGMGEWPLARQATFSLWRDAAAISEFAYRGLEHRRVIREVRTARWYSEELFTRFAPYGSEGTWDGADPLG